MNVALSDPDFVPYQVPPSAANAAVVTAAVVTAAVVTAAGNIPALMLHKSKTIKSVSVALEAQMRVSSC